MKINYSCICGAKFRLNVPCDVTGKVEQLLELFKSKHIGKGHKIINHQKK